MAARASAEDVTSRGLRWIAGSLFLYLACLVGLLVSLLLLLPPVVDSLEGRLAPGVVNNSLGVISLFLGVGEIVAGGVFVIGFADMWTGRLGHGAEHAESVVQSRRYLVVTVVLIAVGVFVMSPTGLVLRIPILGDVLPSWAITGSILVAGLRALFAGLVLYYALHEVAGEERLRLLWGMVLGVVGGVLWPGILAYGTEASPTASSVASAYAASAVAGLGTSAMSLVAFALAYRRAQRRMAAGGTQAAKAARP